MSQTKPLPYRDYSVTVTPKITTYAGNNTSGEYTATISARSRDEAIKLARKDRSDIEGRYGVSATYRAKILKIGEGN